MNLQTEAVRVRDETRRDHRHPPVPDRHLRGHHTHRYPHRPAQPGTQPQPGHLTGANLRYVEARLPHLGRLLAATPQQALRGSDTAVVATAEAAVVQALRATPPDRVIDLSGRLGRDVERLTGYEGLGWTA